MRQILGLIAMAWLLSVSQLPFLTSSTNVSLKPLKFYVEVPSDKTSEVYSYGDAAYDFQV